MTPVIEADGLQRDACNAGQEVREQVRATLNRQDEQLGTFRFRGMDIIEVPYRAPPLVSIDEIAGQALDAIEQGAGRGTIRDMLCQIRVLTGRV